MFISRKQKLMLRGKSY